MSRSQRCPSAICVIVLIDCVSFSSGVFFFDLLEQTIGVFPGQQTIPVFIPDLTPWVRVGRYLPTRVAALLPGFPYSADEAGGLSDEAAKARLKIEPPSSVMVASPIDCGL